MNYEPIGSELAGGDEWMVPVPKRQVRKWRVFLGLGIVVGLVASVLTLVLVRNSGRSKSDLSSETLGLIAEAADVCSGESSAYPSSCGPAVWKACHAARREAEMTRVEAGEDRSNAVLFLCDAAVIAEAGEQAFALVYRYGSQYYQYHWGWYSNAYRPDSHSLPIQSFPFYLFHETLGYWRDYLFLLAFCDAACQNRQDTLVSIILWLQVARNGYKSGFKQMSGATLAVLKPLNEAIRDVLGKYSYYSSNRSLSSIPPKPTLTAAQAVVPSVVPSEVPQMCQNAIASARLDTPEWQSDIQRCELSAEMCSQNSEVEASLREECSRLALAADFEGRWQQLPSVCIAAGKTTALDSPDDPCREAAEELCWHPHRQYQGFSLFEIPDNPAEDFTCAAARVDI